MSLSDLALAGNGGHKKLFQTGAGGAQVLAGTTGLKKHYPRAGII